MKRTIFLLSALCLSLTVFADYQTEYTKGQTDYKKGNYVSAREHFMNVLKEKNGYANAIQYINLCNEKIDEQYKEKISKLEKENRDINKKIIESNNKAIALNNQLSNKTTENITLSLERDTLQKQLNDSTDTIKVLRARIDSLQQEKERKSQNKQRGANKNAQTGQNKSNTNNTAKEKGKEQNNKNKNK